MDEPTLVLHSLRGLSAAEVEFVACDCSGCHVYEVLLASTGVSEEEKRRFVEAFKVALRGLVFGVGVYQNELFINYTFIKNPFEWCGKWRYINRIDGLIGAV